MLIHAKHISFCLVLCYIGQAFIEQNTVLNPIITVTLNCLFHRIVYVFGGQIPHPVMDVTPTYLTQHVLATLRECDYVAHKVLHDSGLLGQ